LAERVRIADRPTTAIGVASIGSIGGGGKPWGGRVGCVGADFGSWEAGADQIQPANAPSPRFVAERGGTGSVAELGQYRVDRVGCPQVVGWGRASALPRCRCKACPCTSNPLTKTPLANLRMKDKWATQAEEMIDGVSLAKAARRCGTRATAAFRWRHRFLAALSGDKPKALSGIVEGDETFIRESFKSKRASMPRKSRKRSGKSAERGLSGEQIPVIVARDRNDATIDAALPKLDRVSIGAALDGIVTPGNEFCCDGGTVIVASARRVGIAARILPKPSKPTRQAPDYHLNNVNAYHGRSKEWLRHFHGVATKTLPNYLGWRRTLMALGGNATSAKMILGASSIGPYQQTTL
jgi:ISXO2-like transposase domain